MNKTFKTYSLIWIICLSLFNVITFVTPSEINGVSKFSSNFWIGYAFITVAFLGNLFCSYIVFKSGNLRKLFYNIPLIRISSIGLFIMLVFGGLAMAVPGFPVWISTIICVAVLAFTAIGIISSSYAADTVENIDFKIKNKTEFIKTTTMQAHNLVNIASTPEMHTLCENVYKSLLYSDPVSTEKIIHIDNKIKDVFIQFEASVSSNNIDDAAEMANELLHLISERNNALILFK